MENTLPSVMIAVPNLGTMHVKLVTLIIKWMNDNQGAWSRISLIAPSGLIPHDTARNFCVKEFLKTDFTHLFFIDSDVVPPYNALRQLLSHEKQAITGLYPSVRNDRRQQKEMKIYNVFRHEIDEESGELVFRNVYGVGVEDIESCGGGCLLIRRDVLEKMDGNWFRFQYWPDGLVKYGEDIDFCNNLQKLGVKLYADFDVICVHHKEIAL